MMGRVSHARVLGAQTFSIQTPSCPPGQHWEDESAGPIRGLRGCVPDRRVVLHLQTTPSVPQAPPPANTVSLPGLELAPMPTLAPAAPAASSAPDRAAAPAPAPCPEPWPWWWILLAGAAGVAAGYYAGKNPKKTKKNVGHAVNAIGGRIVNHATSAAASRLF